MLGRSVEPRWFHRCWTLTPPNARFRLSHMEVNDVPRAKHNDGTSEQSEVAAYRVRLPRFITDEEIGLGDVLKRATSYFGIRPCGGCKRRAAALNRRIVFTR